MQLTSSSIYNSDQYVSSASQYDQYFGKLINVADTKASEEEPIPVQNVPHPPTPQLITNWIVQGGIWGFMIALVVYLGAPTLDLIKLFLSEDARNKRDEKEKESKSQAEMFLAFRESHAEQLKSMKDAQIFMQSMMETQQKHTNSEVTEVYQQLVREISKIQSVQSEQQEALLAILKGSESIKIQISNSKQAIPVRIVKDVEK